MRYRQPSGMDGTGDRPEETQTVLEIPNAGAGKGVPLQRVRLQAEAMGAGQKPEPHGAPGEDMVPEQAHEE